MSNTDLIKFHVIRTGSKQYIAQSGQKLRIEILPGEYKVGDEIVFEDVLMSVDGSKVEVGTPNIAGAKVKAKLVEITRDAKLVVLKYKAKSRYHKKNGHKQPKFVVEIL
jgi:large subunit ribosomal protein L21